MTRLNDKLELDCDLTSESTESLTDQIARPTRRKILGGTVALIIAGLGAGSLRHVPPAEAPKKTSSQPSWGTRRLSAAARPRSSLLPRPPSLPRAVLSNLTCKIASYLNLRFVYLRFSGSLFTPRIPPFRAFVIGALS